MTQWTGVCWEQVTHVVSLLAFCNALLYVKKEIMFFFLTSCIMIAFTSGFLQVLHMSGWWCSVHLHVALPCAFYRYRHIDCMLIPGVNEDESLWLFIICWKNAESPALHPHAYSELLRLHVAVLCSQVLTFAPCGAGDWALLSPLRSSGPRVQSWERERERVKKQAVPVGNLAASVLCLFLSFSLLWKRMVYLFAFVWSVLYVVLSIVRWSPLLFVKTPTQVLVVIQTSPQDLAAAHRLCLSDVSHTFLTG